MMFSAHLKPAHWRDDRIFLCINGLLILTALTAIFHAFFFLDKGIEFSDEGFYLASIAGPWDYITSFSQFGFFYNAVFEILDRNVVYLRIFNLLSINFLALIFAKFITHHLFEIDQNSKLTNHATCLSLSVASLLIFSFHGQWLASPSYNSLALASLFIIASGMVICVEEEDARTFAGFLVIAIGGVLLFMAKMSSAAVLAPTILLALFAAKKIRVREAIILALLSFFSMYVTIIWIDGSITDFIRRISLSLKLIALQDSGYAPVETLSRLIDIPRNIYAKVFIACIVFLFFLAWKGSLSKRPLFFPFFFGGPLLIALLVENIKGEKEYKGVFVQLMLPATLFIGAMLFAVINRKKLVQEIGKNRLILSVFFAILPHVYAFGTNNNYLFQASSAGIFWAISGLVLVSSLLKHQEISRTFLYSFLAATNIYSILIIWMAVEHPYRQYQPLRHADRPVEIGDRDSVIFLNHAQHDFVKNVKNAVQAAQMPPGQPVIDLTGASPGTLFSVGARGVGLAWFVGGFPGSTVVAEEVFKHVSCARLSTAWILTSVGSRKAIDHSAIRAFGADVEKDYVLAAQWLVPPGVRKQGKAVEKLYKPRRTYHDSINSCRYARSEQRGAVE